MVGHLSISKLNPLVLVSLRRSRPGVKGECAYSNVKLKPCIKNGHTGQSNGLLT